MRYPAYAMAEVVVEAMAFNTWLHQYIFLRGKGCIAPPSAPPGCWYCCCLRAYAWGKSCESSPVELLLPPLWCKVPLAKHARACSQTQHVEKLIGLSCAANQNIAPFGAVCRGRTRGRQRQHVLGPGPPVQPPTSGVPRETGLSNVKLGAA